MAPGDTIKIGSLVKLKDPNSRESSSYPDCIGTVVGVWDLNDLLEDVYVMVMWSNGTKSSILVSKLAIVMQT